MWTNKNVPRVIHTYDMVGTTGSQVENTYRYMWQMIWHDVDCAERWTNQRMPRGTFRLANNG
jgi:hypothetical protein